MRERRIQLLKNLSGAERRILKSYLDGDTKSQRFHIASGNAAGLATKGILFCPSNIMFMQEVSYNITEWVWEYLKEHPKLLE